MLSAGTFVLNSPTLVGSAALVLAGGTVAIAAGATVRELASVKFGNLSGSGTLLTTTSLDIGGGPTFRTDYVVVSGGLEWDNVSTITADRVQFGSYPTESLSRNVPGMVRWRAFASTEAERPLGS